MRKSGEDELSGSGAEASPRLVLGPHLRHIGARDATVWVETDAACEVGVLGARAATFRVGGHHYAVVAVRGLEPGGAYPYTVTLDGAAAWPPDGQFPPSVIRTVPADGTIRIAFGSCRATLPHEPPYTLPRDQHPEGRGPDALRALAFRLRRTPPESWPHALLLLGDQVYADEVSPETRAFIRSRRDVREAPGEEVADFEEYAHLYQEAWREPAVRWVLSTVSTAMLWDDHDVHDDWNISQLWVDERRAKPWWRERLVSAYMTYWLYQHLGNLSLGELAEDELLARVREAEDAAPILREHFAAVAEGADGARWSFRRDLGATRLLAVDCRAGRVLAPGRRSMLDEGEWRWVEAQARGDRDHLLIALSDPYLLSPSVHDLEAWNEALCDGAWGRRVARIAERMRISLDFDHWAAFRSSFERLTELLRAVAAGERGAPPATIVALSGDVHNCYLVEAAFARGAGVRSRVYQAVCSPMRNQLTKWERRALRLFDTWPMRRLIGALAARAGVPPPPVRWRYLTRPSFGDQIGTLELSGREALVRVEEAALADGEEAQLRVVFERRLA